MSLSIAGTLASSRRPVAPGASDALRTTQAAQLFKQAQPLANGLSLGFLGEDSAGFVSVSHRPGPVTSFTEDAVLRGMGFKNLDKVKAYDSFSFEPKAKNDPELWDSLDYAAMEPASAAKLKELLTGPQVQQLALVVTDDERKHNMGAHGYLVAHLRDGSLLVFKDQLGGMGF